MAMSGITLDQECEECHQEQKIKNNIQYSIYKIVGLDTKGEKPTIKVDCKSTKKLNAAKANQIKHEHEDELDPEDGKTISEKVRNIFDELVEVLPEDDCRYIVVDYVAKSKSGQFNDRMKFLAWSPDGAKVKRKMVYAATKDTLKKKFGLNKEVLLTSFSKDDCDCAFESLLTEM